MNNPDQVTLDVREELRNGKEPFTLIMKTVTSLTPKQQFVLIAPFQPAPLYAVLRSRGYSHSARQLEGGDWEVTFSRDSDESEAAPADANDEENLLPPSQDVQVDARGLEPPEPMVKILEALAVTPQEGTLRAITDRRPLHLYEHLAERGFKVQTSERADGAFVTEIRHA